MSTTPTMTEPDPLPETVLQAGRRGGPHPKLHVPGSDGEPICWTATDPGRVHERTWQEKSIEVYPEPWRDWCGNCLRVLEADP